VRGRFPTSDLQYFWRQYRLDYQDFDDSLAAVHSTLPSRIHPTAASIGCEPALGASEFTGLG
jgi:hypothetical protein